MDKIITCSKCKKEIPESNFYKNRGHKNGLSSWCKPCRDEVNNKPENKHQRKKYESDIGFRRKIMVFQFYSDGYMKCKNCGFDNIDALSIDHINGDGNKHRKLLRTHGFYQWLITNNFPEGYQVLCMNCQFIKKLEDYDKRKNITRIG